MKIMTFNLRTDFILDINNRWENRAKIVYEVFEKYNCDIIGVQELTNKMFEDISSNLINYNIVGTPRTKKLFVERNDILVLKKHEILEYETFWLSEKPDKVGTSIWYSIYPRICTTAVVKLEGGRVVRIYNTHLDFLLPKAREYGLKKIGKYIENKYEEDNLPVILMGDFNATPKSKAIKELIGGEYSKKKFIAVQESKKEIYEISTMSKFKGNKKGLHIDYIFVPDEFEIRNIEIVDYNKNGKYPSDHYPIMANVWSE